jgi:hypothetical protein
VIKQTLNILAPPAVLKTDNIKVFGGTTDQQKWTRIAHDCYTEESKLLAQHWNPHPDTVIDMQSLSEQKVDYVRRKHNSYCQESAKIAN